nr:FAD dependent oxidoreductase [Colletotrichum truncatum]KAF6789225.1 FAD dependent oxidoreductase [Colletotrichum truncatum]
MGSVFSVLRSAAKGISAVAKLLYDLNKQYQALLLRVNAPPGLPYDKPSNPYWLDEPPFPELVDARSEELPGSADVVIIGSGITGVAVARSLYAGAVVGQQQQQQQGDRGDDPSPLPPRVVVLEARQLCAGATGRNGGHVKASPHELFPRLAAIVGKEKAAALTRFTLRTADAVLEVGAGKQVSECRRVETVDFMLDTAAVEATLKEVEELKKWIPEVEIEVVGREDAARRFGVDGDHVFGAVVYQAGALWPYRLVASCWRELLDEVGDRLSIETGTAVEEIQLGGTQRRPYVLKTARGNIRARHVVHATNAHAAQFLPGLRGKMTGIKAHMTSQRAADGFRWGDGNRSWGFIYGDGGEFDYVTQRPNGDVMLGGGFGRSLKQGVDMVGVYEDGSTEALTVAHVAGVMRSVFGNEWTGSVTRAWSGIICFTGDMAPFVGRVPEGISGRKRGKTSLKVKVKEVDDDDDDGWRGAVAGEWVSAGYCGDGMVWAWLCGTALGVMISGREGDVLEKGVGFPGGKLEEWFPKDLIVTEDRVKKADLSNLLDMFLESGVDFTGGDWD